MEAFKAGWGGAVLKTIGLVPTPHTSPRVHIIRSGKNKRGLLDIELISDMPIDDWEKEIDRIRGMPSRTGRLLPASWAEASRMAGRKSSVAWNLTV